MGDHITQSSIMTDREAGQWAERVCQMRHAWTDAGDGLVYFLGTSAYATANPRIGGSLENYRRSILATNPLLGGGFEPLYQQVEADLSRILGGRFQRNEELGYPGFISWVLQGATPPEPCAIHCDLHYRLLPWESLTGRAEPDELIGFTLPLQLPGEGGGLRTWQSYDEAAARARFFGGDLLSSIHDRACECFEYGVGLLTIQHGLVIHQPYLRGPIHKGEIRMTMQGFGARFGTTWLLYW